MLSFHWKPEKIITALAKLQPLMKFNEYLTCNCKVLDNRETYVQS